MAIYALDIETYPDVDMIGKLPEPEIAKNLKDPEKIAAARIEAKEKQLQDMALNPLYGKIAAYTFYSDLGCYSNCSVDEKKLLIEIESYLNDSQKAEPMNQFLGNITTWNGINFDMPFIYKRMLLNNIEPFRPLTEWTDRYNKSHRDLMQIWAGYGKYEKLDTVCKSVLGYGKKEFDFRKIHELILTEAGRNEILDYNRQDARLVFDLYEKFRNILF